MGKTLIIGGNRFVGLRLSRLLDADAGCELHVLNRSGTAPGTSRAVLHKGSRDDLPATGLDHDWDAVVDFSCYDRAQALGAVRFFREVGLYVHISTGSVYDAGRFLKEAAFDAEAWPQRETPTEEEGKNPYQFGKRQAEAVFAQKADFPTLLVRLPFIVGPDDYTRRFAFHVDRVAKGLPIYFPDVEVRNSFVESLDAARFLRWSLGAELTGPVNVASPQDISLKDLVVEIEAQVGRKAVFAPRESDGNHSPYGLDETQSMDVGRLAAAGFEARPLEAWVPGLIDALKP